MILPIFETIQSKSVCLHAHIKEECRAKLISCFYVNVVLRLGGKDILSFYKTSIAITFYYQ
jgi:hypothetical protein